jgi:hypothetical protein
MIVDRRPECRRFHRRRPVHCSARVDAAPIEHRFDLAIPTLTNICVVCMMRLMPLLLCSSFLPASQYRVPRIDMIILDRELVNTMDAVQKVSNELEMIII